MGNGVQPNKAINTPLDGGGHIYDLKHDMHRCYKQRLNKFIQTGTASGVCKTVNVQLEIERSDNSQR